MAVHNLPDGCVSVVGFHVFICARGPKPRPCITLPCIKKDFILREFWPELVMHNNKSVDNLSIVRGLLIFSFLENSKFIYLFIYFLFFCKIATHVVAAA